MRRISRVAAGVPEGGQFAASARGESTVALAERPEDVDYTAPRGIDPTWFDRLEAHQQRDLVEDGTIGIEDASGDIVEVRPGIVDEDADWVFKNGQCLALAVAAAEECGGKVYCQRVDFDDTDEHGQPFANLRHAYVLTPDGVLLDIGGEHGAPEDLPDADTDEFGIPIDGPAPDPLVFDNPADALAHFEGYLVDQDLTVAEPFARRMLATYRLGSFVGETDYDAIGPDDARALLDTDLVRRYTQGDCGVLAHYLAESNGWGVTVVGEYEEEDWGVGEPSYDVTHLSHAYARRPDGMLVDVRGVHDPKTVLSPTGMCDEFGFISSVHDYPDAESADRVWNHEQWLDGERWNDSYVDSDDRDLATHVARLVTVAYGRG